jgi:starch synthase
MQKTIKVLFLAAEAEPFVKVGGLGDVAGSLPHALLGLPEDIRGEFEIDIRLALPYHSVIRSRAKSIRPLLNFSVQNAGESEEIAEVFEFNDGDLPVYFVDGENTQQLGWRPDIIHANDWHTATACYAGLVQHWQEGKSRPASVITVHNLPFMGPDAQATLESYGLPLAQTDLPAWARPKPLPLGLWATDEIVAVSPTYAVEMLTEEYGSGLHEFLATRRDILTGILNGLDTKSFDPATDQEIASNFTAATLSDRSANKFDLQKRLGFSTDLTVPLLGVVSRMDQQKGIDLVITILERLKELPWQAVILSAGDPELEKKAHKLQTKLPEKVHVETRYDATLARQIYAGADIFLMPSRYEPCGLSQMISMRYGCVPVVRAVGGLHDTVTDGETGFVFIKPTAKDFIKAIERALDTYQDTDKWQEMQRAGMIQDFSWANSAAQYFELYKRLMTKEATKA